MDKDEEILILRNYLIQIYNKAGEELWASRRRSDTSGHHCDYKNALHACKDYAKKALSHSCKNSPPQS